MGYRITLSEEDVGTIAFVGNRYAWSDALASLEAGENLLTEPEAWEIAQAFEADTEGRHSPFPMLDGRSALAEELYRFWGSIV